uniref:NADH-ubiquinone oxidoreductase chain 4L n=1 Tax=Macoma balthica TaxID=1903275 RepID=A0A6H2U280_MACBL|nr:NADH dehydrogenase subunit 4L [Macoma balthica]
MYGFLMALSFFCMFSQKDHFLMVMLALEQGVLSAYGVTMGLAGLGLNSSMVGLSVLFLIVGVCEAAVGLGLLVSRCRVSGKDSLGSLFSLS